MGLAEEMLKRHDELHLELTQSKARIRELENALSKIIQTYPIDALGLTVDARMREIARDILSEKSNQSDTEVQDG